MKITKQMLIDADACDDQVALFEKTFPDGATWPDDVEKAGRAGLDVGWAAVKFKLSGRCRGWYSNGQLDYDENYEHGELHGRCQLWYPNGQLWYDKNYEHWKRHGRCRGWYDNGQLEYEANYEYGERHGLCRWWHSNGQLWYEDNYEHGKRK